MALWLVVSLVVLALVVLVSRGLLGAAVAGIFAPAPPAQARMASGLPVSMHDLRDVTPR